MGQAYRVGIVGCGSMAHVHARGYMSVPGITLTGVADVDPKALRAFQVEFGVADAFSGYIDLLETVCPDILSVCTWPQFRARIVIDACRYPVRAIYAEKPMCMNLREADAMIDACRTAGIALIVGHQRRFGSRWVQAKRLLDAGAVGRLQRFEAGCPGWDIFQWGTHWVDTARFFNNDDPAEWVFAQVGREYDRTAFGHRLETECMTVIGFQNGVRAYIETGDHLAGNAGFFNRLIGSDGMIEIDTPHGGPLRLFTQSHGLMQPEVPEGDAEPTRPVVEALMATLERGVRHPLDAASARATMEILMATFQSAGSGRLVHLPLSVTDSPFEAMLARSGLPLIVSGWDAGRP